MEKNRVLNHSINHSVTHPAYLMPHEPKLLLRNYVIFNAEIRLNASMHFDTTPGFYVNMAFTDHMTIGN